VPNQPDLSGLLKQAQKMQEQLASAQAAAAAAVVEGHSGGGAVRVEVSGTMDFRAVHIDPKVIDPDDVEMLEDLVLAALHDATARVHELSAQALPDLGALGDLGGLGGLLGSPE
jgi:DNA-binding YbaB/EbfC family protein